MSAPASAAARQVAPAKVTTIRQAGRFKPLKISVTRSVDGLLALESDWRALEAQADIPCLFQSFDWCANYVRHAGDTQPLAVRVLSAWQGERLVALLPLCVQTNNGARVLTGLTEPFQQYTDMLVAPGVDAKIVFGEMLRSLRALDVDYLHFGQVREDGNLFRALDGVVPPSGEEDAAPYVRIGDFPDFETFHRTVVNAKTRKNMRNARNRLERDAPVMHEVARSGPLLSEVIDRSFEGREAWLERQGLTSRAFRDHNFGAFLDRFKRPERTGVETVAFSLTYGGNPVADQWGFIHRGRYYAFIASWDAAYEEASPGKMHLGEILAACHGLGIEVADFMIPAARYKFTWASDAVKVRDFVMPLSWKGRLHNALWLNFLRPLAKRIAYAMPVGLRAWIFAKVMPVKD